MAGSPLFSNRYQLHEKLGEGGMGVVYRATDRLTGQPVALKRLLMLDEVNETVNNTNTTIDLRLSIAHEFQALAGLRHPNIIPVLDYGFDEQRQPFFTMKLLENARTLTAAAAELDLAGQVRLLVEALRALDYIHRRRIIHRDLKPANVLVDTSGIVFVLDFGLVMQETADTRAQDGVRGTLAYMAPETLVQKPATHASDLYAVGVMAYEIFAGHFPYNATSLMLIVSGILNEIPDYSDLPDPLADVLARLLAKDPEDRYHSAIQVIEELCHATGLPVPPETAESRDSYLQAATFVGREAELDLLQQGLQAARDGYGSSWLVVGESGIGKSRLLDELRVRALPTGVTVLSGQAVAEGGLPYQLWRDILRRLALSTKLSALEAAILKEIVPDIAALLGQPVADAPSLDGKAAQQRLVLTLLDVLRRQTGTVLLLLEDLHWTSESLEPLRMLNEVIQELPWLVIGTYRDEETPDMTNRLPGMHPIRLARLGEEAVAALSAAMLGKIGTTPEVLDLLRRETEGNTFFMVEVVRALAEEAGTLGAVGQMPLPASVGAQGVMAILRRRLSRIPLRSQRALKLAAVAGREIDLKVMNATERKFDQETWLTDCANTAVLEIYDGKWRFAHDRLRQTVLQNIDADERPALHRTIATALETAYPSDAGFGEALAEHWFAAGDVPRTLDYTLKASHRLIQLAADYERAVNLLTRGLTLAESPDLAQYRAALLRLLGDADLSRARYENAIESYQAALAEKSIALETQMWTLIGLSRVDYHLSRLATSRQYAEQAMQRAAQIHHDAGLAFSLNQLGIAATIEGDFESARRCYSQSLSIRQRLGDRQGVADSLANQGILARRQGEFEAARQYFTESLTIRREIADRRGISISLNNLGMTLEALGLYDAIIESYTESLQISREINDTWSIANTLTNLATAQVKMKHLADASHNLQEAIEIAWRIHAHAILLWAITVTGKIHLMQGHAESAAVLAGFVNSHAQTDVALRSGQLEPLMGELKTALDAPALAYALERGKALELEVVVRELLVELAGV